MYSNSKILFSSRLFICLKKLVIHFLYVSVFNFCKFFGVLVALQSKNLTAFYWFWGRMWTVFWLNFWRNSNTNQKRHKFSSDSRLWLRRTSIPFQTLFQIKLLRTSVQFLSNRSKVDHIPDLSYWTNTLIFHFWQLEKETRLSFDFWIRDFFENLLEKLDYNLYLLSLWNKTETLNIIYLCHEAKIKWLNRCFDS